MTLNFYRRLLSIVVNTTILHMHDYASLDPLGFFPLRSLKWNH